ncbi:TetR family transcriptional regulator [Carbonactinospora thermoautotrophica]|uniref:TetR family transcriptional regulator n=1 Tax=Carbonactinospora thermoautotrophica TaxID=1469144 RepID=UPI00099F0A57|nr:TetR family transcriptional regulator [Carbonactinospora thermoautotrophica]
MRSDDVTARARIRDAALARFGAQGVDRVSLRAIAADAGVSPALVVHYFGSKEGLRQACDAYVVEVIRRKSAWARQETDPASPSGLAAMRSMLEAGDLVRRYLARALLDGSPQAAALFDEMVQITEEFLTAGERDGSVEPTSDPRARAALFVTWQLSGLVLSQHLARALDVEDLFALPGLMRLSRVTVEMCTHGLFTDERWLAAYDVLQERLHDLYPEGRLPSSSAAARTTDPDPPEPAAGPGRPGVHPTADDEEESR